MDNKVKNSRPENSFTSAHGRTEVFHMEEMNTAYLLAEQPSFIVRAGSLMFFLIFLLVILGCYFIRYPDVLKSTGSLISVNGPKNVIVKRDSKLEHLFIQDGSAVKKGEVLGYLESTANHKQVLSLSFFIDSIIIKTRDGYRYLAPTLLNQEIANLGELQVFYNEFMRACVYYSRYTDDGFFPEKRHLLVKDSETLASQQEALDTKGKLLLEDFLLTDSSLRVNDLLRIDGVISTLEHRSERSKFLNKKMAIKDIEFEVLKSRIQQSEVSKQISEIDNDIKIQHLYFLQALTTFKSQIDAWKELYLLTSPQDGVISFSSSIQKNQHLKQGESFCFVSPDNSDFYIETVLPQTNFGKIRIGQKAVVKFDAYPFEEFGFVEGFVDYIYSIPQESGFLARISLPKKLHSNYNVQFRYNLNLSSTVEIITNEKSLLERILSRLKGKKM